MTTFTLSGEEIVAPVVVNRFPAKVVAPDGETWDQVRAVLTDVDLFVYGLVPGDLGQDRAAVVRRVSTVAMRPNGALWIVADTDGGEWQVGPGSGCGCSSPLKFLPSPLPADL